MFAKPFYVGVSGMPPTKAAHFGVAFGVTQNPGSKVMDSRTERWYMIAA